VTTDLRWYSTLPADEVGAPILELRRWPGDSVLAVWVLEGATLTDRPPPLPGSDLTRVGGSKDGRREWRGRLRTPGGERPIVWLEWTVPQATRRLGLLLAPGDAGLPGDSVGVSLLAELRAVAERLEARPRSLNVGPAAQPAQPLSLPRMAAAPGQHSERTSPWQVVRGLGFTLGLPPGIRARRTDTAVAPGGVVPGGLLWLRGFFEDIEGTSVVIGDSSRAGYLAQAPEATDEWVLGTEPPLGLAEARLIRAEEIRLGPFGSPARRVKVSRWSESGYSGEWLVFRLAVETGGVEIALPVSAGRKSPSLYWIAASWRMATQQPAPPPVDPAARFGIRFDRLTRAEKMGQPWTEGTLEVPGLLIDLPAGWFPAAALRSSDGYPVRLLDDAGRALGELTRVAAGEVASWARGDDSVWKKADKLAGSRAGGIYRQEGGSLRLVAREGHGFQLMRTLEASALDEEGEAAFVEMWQRMVASLRLVRPERERTRAEPQ